MENKLRSVIIEDEPGSLQLLHNLLDANGNVIVVGESSDPFKAIDLLLETKPDLLFLDIKMPGKSGFEILDDMRKIRSLNPYVVFITAYNEFAIRAFEYAAFDYLLKPVDPVRLNDSILRCIDSKSSDRSQKTQLLLESIKKIHFRNTSGFIFIDPLEIIYVEAAGNYSVFHLSDNRTETVTMLLGKIHEMLDSEIFFRISRSCIINLNDLKKINSKQLQCILSRDGTELKCDISRERISELLRKMD
jgi:DNA-binding LytR/AlgR family response regulator